MGNPQILHRCAIDFRTKHTKLANVMYREVCWAAGRCSFDVRSTLVARLGGIFQPPTTNQGLPCPATEVEKVRTAEPIGPHWVPRLQPLKCGHLALASGYLEAVVVPMDPQSTNLVTFRIRELINLT